MTLALPQWLKATLTTLSIAASTSIIYGCTDGSDTLPDFNLDNVPFNQLQYLGTHNSYHIAPEPELLELLLAIL